MATGPKQTERITVAEAGLSDTLPDVDRLGFAPYVDALAAFLMAPETTGPLTVSVEGPWGVGKSSFMKLLREGISARDDVPIVSFNAWRHEKNESLWAAFALAVIEQLTPKHKYATRATINLKLLVSRIDWSRGWWPILRAAGLLVGFISLAVFAGVEYVRAQGGMGAPPATSASHVWLSIGGGALAAAALTNGIKRAREVLGNPLAVDLARYVEAPRYREKLEFLENFDADLAKIVKSYVGEKHAGKVFVFIDDLDRTEATKAADVMQAINLLMSAEGLRFIFILGIDRRAVAASLAAKADKLVPYLMTNFGPSKVETQTRQGLEYGYAYLEKFIQIPFAVPRPSAEVLPAFIASLDRRADRRSAAAPGPSTDPRPPEVEVTFATDSERFRDIVASVAETLQYNPRRLKQFVNVFRLRAYISSKTGLFQPGKNGRALTLEQLAKFTAATLRWPQFGVDLARDTTLLERLFDDEPGTVRDDGEFYWWSSGEFQRLLRYGTTPDTQNSVYDMRGLDVVRLLEVSPAYVPLAEAHAAPEPGPPQQSKTTPPPNAPPPSSNAPPLTSAKPESNPTPRSRGVSRGGGR